MNKSTKILMTGFVLFLAVPALCGDGDDPKKVKELMQKKLEHAQKILEGVVKEDFKEIANHAEDLMEISKAVEWHVVKTPRYEVQSNQFRRTLEELMDKAKEKNLDGAALSYME